MGWVSGPEAVEMELHSNEEILKSIMFVFERFLTGTVNYTTPIRVLPSRWNSNPFTRGSYSSRSVETDERNAWAFDLSEPLYNSVGREVVLFAGEATHDDFFSAAHGAIESGFREAQRLMELDDDS